MKPLPACNSIYYNECQLNFNVKSWEGGGEERNEKKTNESERKTESFDAAESGEVCSSLMVNETTNFHIFASMEYLFALILQAEKWISTPVLEQAHTCT